MRMSTKGRFAVNAMIDLTLRERGGPVALAAIATRQQISLSYLEQLFSRLRRAGLVQSTRGPGGGYTLGRDAQEISVADVMLAVEDGEFDGEERGREDAGRGPDLSGALWSNVQEVMLRHMATITLRTLADEQIAAGYVADEKPMRRAIGPLPQPLATKPVRSNAPNSVFAFGQSFAR